MGFKMPKFSPKDLLVPSTDMVNASKNVVGGVATGVGAGTVFANDYFRKQKSDKRDKDAAAAQQRAAEAQKIGDTYNAERDASRIAMQDLINSSAPQITAGTIDPMWRQKQADLIAQLTNQASGQGQSLAQQQFQQASNTALQKTMGAIRAATGSNAALNARTSALASTNLLGNMASESGMARLKEQQDAQNALAGLLAQGRTADMQQRQQDIAMSQANADVALKNKGLSGDLLSQLLGNTTTRYENHYNRTSNEGMASKKGAGGSNSMLPAILQTGGAVIGSIYGGPAGGAGGAMAGKAVGDSVSRGGGNLMAGENTADTSGMSLAATKFVGPGSTGRPNVPLRSGPFGRVLK